MSASRGSYDFSKSWATSSAGYQLKSISVDFDAKKVIEHWTVANTCDTGTNLKIQQKLKHQQQQKQQKYKKTKKVARKQQLHKKKTQKKKAHHKTTDATFKARAKGVKIGMGKTPIPMAKKT
jgi:hypothetical protein